jgi:hypothetical protein
MAEVSLPHQHGFKDGTLAIPSGSRAIRRRPTSEIGLAWPRPAIADTVGSPGPDAGASCTGSGALAKHGPAGPTPRGRLPRRIEPTRPTYGTVPELVQSDADTPLARKTGSGVKAGGGTPRRRTEGRTRLNGHYVDDRSGPRHVARRQHSKRNWYNYASAI